MTLDELAEQAAKSANDILGNTWVPDEYFVQQVKIIREALEAATQAQREQLEQLTGKLEFNERGYRLVQAQKEAADARAEQAEQQLSHVTQDTQALMLKAWEEGWFARNVETFGSATETRKNECIDHLLAEHKAQQPCATPTSSSPLAATDIRSSAGDARRTQP